MSFFHYLVCSTVLLRFYSRSKILGNGVSLRPPLPSFSLHKLFLITSIKTPSLNAYRKLLPSYLELHCLEAIGLHYHPSVYAPPSPTGEHILIQSCPKAKKMLALRRQTTPNLAPSKQPVLKMCVGFFLHPFPRSPAPLLPLLFFLLTYGRTLMRITLVTTCEHSRLLSCKERLTASPSGAKLHP